MTPHASAGEERHKPIAGLIRDLKSRGLLDDTLVLQTTEFGRTPTADGPKGRSHHTPGFSSWLAGGRVKGGIVHGKSDEFGAKSVEDGVHVHDSPATSFTCSASTTSARTFRNAERDFRLTDVSGNVVKAILA